MRKSSRQTLRIRFCCDAQDVRLEENRWFRACKREAVTRLRELGINATRVLPQFEVSGVQRMTGPVLGRELKLYVGRDHINAIEEIGSPTDLISEERWVWVHIAKACEVALEGNDPAERERLAHVIEREYSRLARIEQSREKQRIARLRRGTLAPTSEFVRRSVQTAHVKSWDVFVALVSDELRVEDLTTLEPSLSLDAKLNSTQDVVEFTLYPDTDRESEKKLSKKNVQNLISRFRKQSI